MPVEIAPGAEVRRERIRVNGIVQGVGFRPYVFRLATECGLAGFVNNDSEGVTIEVEGSAPALRSFRERLKAEPPPLARVMELRVEEARPEGAALFAIRESRRGAAAATMIAPDVAVCDDCLRELFDPLDRRHLYPFINCTRCGPRYTITRALPYDRPNTSMAPFALCAACLREFHDPGDRRFHAQPNACPACGPRLTLADRAGRAVETGDPIGAAARLLRDGAIVALRGLGGFHLAVDARNDGAVRELRRRKGRAGKPFALMAADLAVVERHCRLTSAERREILSPERPILLLDRRPGSTLAPAVAPGCSSLGFMLPAAPLHHLLLRDRFEALVMTSGNLAEEPIAIGNQEAVDRLGGIADAFLLHDREILQRCDDSIAQVVEGRTIVLRRSRGHVPAPVRLRRPIRLRILGCGGEMRSAIALARGSSVFFSQHIGDLDNPEALAFFERSIEHLSGLLEIRPEAIAHDLHPDYLSTRWAVCADLPRVAVQHHHAHLASAMAENGVEDRTIGLILDGTGYGTDGTIWGGEVLIGDYLGFERLAWLETLPMPGGEKAIRQPWRMAVSALHAAFGTGLPRLDLPFLAALPPRDVGTILTMIDRRFNAPLTSSCGRLFDAVSALLGLRSEVTYEAQAAVELEAAIDETERGSWDEAVEGSGIGPLPTAPLVRALVSEIRRGTGVPVIAARFHRTLASILLRAALSAREARGVNRVALSGGVFQNRHLLIDLSSRLRERGFEVLTHGSVPPNDGGLALGQIVVADARLREA